MAFPREEYSLLYFSIYIGLSDVPTPPEVVKLQTYADDITTLSTHKDIHIAERQMKPYLDELRKWIEENDFKLNTDKSLAIPFIFDSAQYSTKLQLQINHIIIHM